MKSFSKADLAKYSHLPLDEVAKELGVCGTILKRICRRHGIRRWPYRKIRSLEKSIAAVEEACGRALPPEQSRLVANLHVLRAKRDMLRTFQSPAKDTPADAADDGSDSSDEPMTDSHVDLHNPTKTKQEAPETVSITPPPLPVPHFRPPSSSSVRSLINDLPAPRKQAPVQILSAPTSPLVGEHFRPGSFMPSPGMSQTELTRTPSPPQCQEVWLRVAPLQMRTVVAPEGPTCASSPRKLLPLEPRVTINPLSADWFLKLASMPRPTARASQDLELPPLAWTLR